MTVAGLILIADDEVSIFQLARLYLEQEGFRVIYAGDGVQSLNIIRAQRPALVVLDVMLPGLSGFEVCRRIRAEDNQIPILILTVRDDDIDKILGLELGADDYLTKPFNPRELVARVKAILRRSHSQPHPEEGGVQVGDGDGDKLSQVFTNLLDNAIKFSPAGQQVLITTKKVSDGIVVCVQDSGPGTDPQDRERVFERFYPTDPSRCEGPTHGSGLGLAIAHQVIQLHRGKIWVEGEPDKGSEFFVWLPVCHPDVC